ncbi:MAG: kelch repeat-containing protein [Thermoplasmata archaeon]
MALAVTANRPPRAIRVLVALAAVTSLLTLPTGPATGDPGEGFGLRSDASYGETALFSADPAPLRPSNRGFHGAAYDAESDRFVIVGGGRAPAFFGDVWAYDFNSNTWEEMPPSNGPATWVAGASAYDAESDRILLFGGQSEGFIELNETWAYDYNTNTWEAMNPSPAPPPRHAVRGAYDAESDRFIVVGGHIGGGLTRRADAWAYDYNTDTWQNVTPSGFFQASYASIAYDAESDRVIHFSGENATAGFRQETWSYDYNTNTWAMLQPVVQPDPQWIQSMAYDAAADHIVLAGSNVTWTYDYNANEWTEKSPATQPFPRSAHQVAYDGESDRTVFFGGCLTVLELCTNDTWAYDSNTNTWTVTIEAPPLGPRNLDASAGEGRVDLAWDPPLYDGGAPITAHRIYRGPTAATDTFLVQVGGERTYTDTGVTGGTLYFSRVTAVTSGGEGAKSSLSSVTPQADTTPPTVSITSPSPDATVTSASIEVTGTASDNAAVDKVEISTDQATWIPVEGTTSWSGALTLADGPNTIYARSTDVAGNVGTTSVPVTYTPSTPPNGTDVPPWWQDPLMLGALLAVATGVTIAILILLRRRGKP